MNQQLVKPIDMRTSGIENYEVYVGEEEIHWVEPIATTTITINKYFEQLTAFTQTNQKMLSDVTQSKQTTVCSQLIRKLNLRFFSCVFLIVIDSPLQKTLCLSINFWLRPGCECVYAYVLYFIVGITIASSVNIMVFALSSSMCLIVYNRDGANCASHFDCMASSTAH